MGDFAFTFYNEKKGQWDRKEVREKSSQMIETEESKTTYRK